MEYTERAVTQKSPLHEKELEQASNAYVMAIVSLIVGLPLPIVNIIASLIYYLGNLKSAYYVRWHCLQAILAQCIMIPFNSIAMGWTIAIILGDDRPGWLYGFYLTGVIILNIAEFVAVMATAAKVRKGENIRWFLIANITDKLCSKRTDPYTI